MELGALGYFSRTHGLKGHLVLHSDLNFNLKKLKALFVDMNGSQAPYFVEEIKPFSGAYLVKLEGVDNVESSTRLKGKQVQIETKFIPKEKTFEYLDFLLIDEEKGELGRIEGLEEMPGNPLLKVNRAGQEILLPFNRDLIVKVSKKEKQIVYRSPEGLLDIYL